MNIQNILERDGAIFLEKIPLPGYKSKIRFICACGKEFTKHEGSLRNSRARCKSCGLKHLAAIGSSKTDIRRARKYFLDAGCFPLFFSMPGGMRNFKAPFICSCGRRDIWAISSFYKKRKPKCRECSRILNPIRNRCGRKTPRPGQLVWANLIFRKYNWVCVITGERGVKLIAHHLHSWVDHPESRYDLENGVCLSEYLHKEFHAIYGKGHNTPEQFIEFVERVWEND